MTNDTRPVHVQADLTFAVVPTWVIDAPITATDVRLYAVLRRYADQTGAAWPSRATLAERLRVSTDTIDRSVRRLVGIGAVTVTHRRDDTGALTSSLYRVHAQPVGAPVDNPEGVAAPVRRGGRTDAEGVAAPVRKEREPLNERTPQPPLRGGARCDVHGEDVQPNRRCCGTTPRQIADAQRRERPTWCGSCDERTRLLETDAGPRRCELCHPLGASS